jgi:hypothetical protein
VRSPGILWNQKISEENLAVVDPAPEQVATAATAIGKAQAKQLGVGTTSKEAARILQTYANPSAVGQSTNALAK